MFLTSLVSPLLVVCLFPLYMWARINYKSFGHALAIREGPLFDCWPVSRLETRLLESRSALRGIIFEAAVLFYQSQSMKMAFFGVLTPIIALWFQGRMLDAELALGIFRCKSFKIFLIPADCASRNSLIFSLNYCPSGDWLILRSWVSRQIDSFPCFKANFTFLILFHRHHKHLRVLNPLVLLENISSVSTKRKILCLLLLFWRIRALEVNNSRC